MVTPYRSRALVIHPNWVNEQYSAQGIFIHLILDRCDIQGKIEIDSATATLIAALLCEERKKWTTCKAI